MEEVALSQQERREKEKRLPAIILFLIIEVTGQFWKPAFLGSYDYSVFKYVILSPIFGFALVLLGLIRLVKSFRKRSHVDITRWLWNSKFRVEKTKEPIRFFLFEVLEFITYIGLMILGFVIALYL